jgi:hypothetical protein
MPQAPMTPKEVKAMEAARRDYEEIRNGFFPVMADLCLVEASRDQFLILHVELRQRDSLLFILRVTHRCDFESFFRPTEKCRILPFQAS